MTFDPILSAPPVVQLHLAAAVLAIVAATLQFATPKGTMWHKARGWFWSAAMAVTAASSFWIWGLFGTFGPIHILSVVVLIYLPLGIYRARQGRIAHHAAIMRHLVFGALILAGVFTLVPGRLLGEALFSW